MTELPVRRRILRLLAVMMAICVCEGANTVRAATVQSTVASSPIHFLDASIASRNASSADVPTIPMRIFGAADAAEESASPAALTSPAPLASFSAGEGEFNVPSPSGAAGPLHVLTVTNDGFRIQDRSGVVVALMSEGTFWSTGGTLYHYSPRVVYDRYANRWIVVAAYRDIPNGQAGVALAVSRNSDPTDFWDRYILPAAPDQWFDFPAAGFNQQTVTITANAIDNSGPNEVVTWFFDKSGLYATDGTPVTFSSLTMPPSVITPVSVYGVDPGPIYFVETLQGHDSVRIFREFEGGFVTVGTALAPQGTSELAPSLAQLGTSARIRPRDTRVTNAVLRDGVFWLVQTVFLPASQSTRSAVQWWKLSSAGALLDIGRIDDPSGGVSYCFPSIAVNANSDVAIGFSRISASSYPSAGYAVRSASDPAGTTRTPAVLKSGEGPYGDPRWGEYSATVVDPDETTFWTLQEYAAIPADAPRWGVWWGHVPAPQPQPSRRRSVRH